MSVYSYVNEGIKMQFIGPMSQYQACLQRGGCNTINNTPQQAWNQLNSLLNGDPRTSGERLPYLTDIFWLNEPFVYSASAQGAEAPEASPAPSETYFIEGLQTALRSEQISEAVRKSLQEKLDLAQKLAARSAVKSASPGEKTLTQSILPVRAGGTGFTTEEEIIEGSEGVLRTWEADIQNVWEGKRGGLYYQVLAGAAEDDPQQGLIMVIETNPDTNQRDQQVYFTSEKQGALRITKVQENKVSLTTAGGSSLIFDLSVRAFQP
jgi:hypothetical protein